MELARDLINFHLLDLCNDVFQCIRSRSFFALFEKPQLNKVRTKRPSFFWGFHRENYQHGLYLIPVLLVNPT